MRIRAFWSLIVKRFTRGIRIYGACCRWQGIVMANQPVTDDDKPTIRRLIRNADRILALNDKWFPK